MPAITEQKQEAKPYAVVKVYATGYKAMSRHANLVDAAKIASAGALHVCATIVRDGTTGRRLTQFEAGMIVRRATC